MARVVTGHSATTTSRLYVTDGPCEWPRSEMSTPSRLRSDRHQWSTMSSGFQDRVNAISLVIRDGNGFGSPLGPSYVYAVGETPTTFSNLRICASAAMALRRRRSQREAVHRAVMSPSAMDGVTDWLQWWSTWNRRSPIRHDRETRAALVTGAVVLHSHGPIRQCCSTCRPCSATPCFFHTGLDPEYHTTSTPSTSGPTTPLRSPDTVYPPLQESTRTRSRPLVAGSGPRRSCRATELATCPASGALGGH